MSLMHPIANNDELENVVLWSIDAQKDKAVYISSNIETVFGVSQEQVLLDYKLWSKLIHKEDSAVLCKMASAIRQGTPFVEEHRLRTRDKWDRRVRWVRTYGMPIKDEYGKLMRMDGTSVDISECKLDRFAAEKKSYEEEIRKLEFYDALTGLPNRQLFHYRIRRAIMETSTKEDKFGILFIDIDRFTPINMTFGHRVGDLFLQKVASRMQESLGNEGIIARLRGDEFAVLVPQLEDEEALAAAAARLVKAWRRPVSIHGVETLVTVSIGACVFPKHGRDEISLMKNAYTATQKAKENGRNRAQMYQPYMNEHAYDRFVLAGEFHRALMMNEFILYYQPRLNINTNAIECVEALIRWNHPKRGMLSPAEFIPLAEETGFIVALGTWVLDEACRQAKEWQSQGIAPVRVAVNVSALQFMQSNFIESVKNVLLSCMLDAQRLEIEITESTLMRSEDNIKMLEELRGIGVKVSIDDFGTGYSSLNYLAKFKVSALKIDKSFVQDYQSGILVKTIIQLAQSLGLSAVAEGVETQEQYDFLKENGCDEAQGFMIGKPVHPEQCAFLLRREQERERN